MITRFFAWWFNFSGWKVKGTIPPEIKKAVVIAAPHTSNWDFVYSLAAFHILNHKVNYLAKKELFKFPLKFILNATGAIPVERSMSHNLVDTIIQKFKDTDNLYLMIPAEGTRKKVTKWKSGFYHAGLGAKVPILLGYLDYENKLAGFGKVIYLTGDKEKDMTVIRDFYKGIKGHKPDNFDPDAIKLD
jgi:1-acyl-sn-glycerol-3-phosphate acyltransferase